MKAVISAGGKGTRVSGVSSGLPKPLIDIGGRSVLEHQIALLARHGIRDIVVTTNHLADKIAERLGDGSLFGVHLKCFREAEPLGTAGGLKDIQSELDGPFLFLYGDVMLDMDLTRLISFHAGSRADCTLVLHPNDHPFDSDLVEMDSSCRVSGVNAKPHPDGVWMRNLANAGVYVLSTSVLKHIERGVKADFAHDVLPALCREMRVYGYVTPEYIKDMGSPERLEKVRRDYLTGKIARLSARRPAVFLDRDGVINEENGLVSSPEQFRLAKGAARGIRLINDSGLLAVVASNQPVVARGLCGIETVEQIHRKMETLLGAEGAYLDAVYYCPHHPDKGFPGENPDYKIDCPCRKPKTGMLDRAARELNIDMSGSFFVGDSDRDILCGRNAGVKTAGIKSPRIKEQKPDMMFDSLYDAAVFITGGGKP